MSKKRKEEVLISQLITRSVIYMYVIMMVGLFPIFFLSPIIPLISAKIILFKILNIILISMLFLGGISWLSERKTRGPWERKKLSVTIVDSFAIILAIAMIASTLISPNVLEAFWGTLGKKFGAFILLLSIMNYFFISRFFKLDQIAIWIYMLGSSVTFILQIVNNWGWNPLNLWTKSEQFASTIGNINLNAAYDVLMLTIGMGLFFIAKEKISEYVYAIYLFIGFCGLLCCRSDLGIVGITTGFFVLALFKLKEEESFLKYMKLVILFGVSAGSVAVGSIVGAKYMFPFESFIACITIPYIPVFIVGLGIAMIALYRRQKKSGKSIEKFLDKIYKFFLGMTIILVVTGIIIFIVINTIYKESVIPNWLGKLRFNDAFASDRGYIWKRTVKAYAKSPLKYKIFGYGANCFPEFINPMYYEEMVNTRPSLFWDAHNELLQMLVTTGIMGVIGYFGMLISSIAQSIRTISENKKAIIPVIVFFSLLAQGMFYSPHVTITPLVFIFMGIVESERRCKSNRSGT